MCLVCFHPCFFFCFFIFFFFKQKTAYEMRISDWSSDVCSSDLDGETAWRSGLALAQGGEFCFALMAQMQQNRMLPDELGGLLLAATFCSMLLTPLLLRGAPNIALRLHRKPNSEAQIEAIRSLTADLANPQSEDRRIGKE